MKAIFLVIALTWWFNVVARSETVEMTAGPDLSVTYDPALWRLAEPVQKTEENTRQTARWQLQRPEWAEITVASNGAPKTESEFKTEILERQKFRGDPADLIREHHQSLASREWLVLEFQNRHTRPTRSEIHYFLPTKEGYASIFVIGEEATLPKNREAIEGLLQQVQVK